MTVEFITASSLASGGVLAPPGIKPGKAIGAGWRLSKGLSFRPRSCVFTANYVTLHPIGQS